MGSDDECPSASYILHEEIREQQITCITAIDRYLYLTTNTELKLYIDFSTSDAFRSSTTTTSNATSKNVPLHTVTSASKQNSSSPSPASSPSHNVRRHQSKNKHARSKSPRMANLHKSSSGFTRRAFPQRPGSSQTQPEKNSTETTVAPCIASSPEPGLKYIVSLTLNQQPSALSSFWHLSARPWQHHQNADSSAAAANTTVKPAGSVQSNASSAQHQNYLSPGPKDAASVAANKQNRKASAVSTKQAATAVLPQPLNCESHLIVACTDAGHIQIVLAVLENDEQFLLPLYFMGDGTLISFATSPALATGNSSKKERFSAADIVQIDISPHGSYVAVYHGNKKNSSSDEETSRALPNRTAAVTSPETWSNETGSIVPAQSSSPKTNALQSRHFSNAPTQLPSESAFCIDIYEAPRAEWNYEVGKFLQHIQLSSSKGDATSVADKCNKVVQQLQTAVAGASTGSIALSAMEKLNRKALGLGCTGVGGGTIYTLYTPSQLPPTLLFRIRSPYWSLINVLYNGDATVNTIGNVLEVKPTNESDNQQRRVAPVGGIRSHTKSPSSVTTPNPDSSTEGASTDLRGSLVQRVLASLAEGIAMPIATQEAMERAIKRNISDISNEDVRQHELNCLPTIHFITRNAIVYANKLSGLQRKAPRQPTGTDSLVIRWTGSCQVQHYAVKVPQQEPQANIAADPNVSNDVNEIRVSETGSAEPSAAKAETPVVSDGSFPAGNSTVVPGDNNSINTSEERDRRQCLQQLIRTPSRCWNYCHTVTSSAIGPEAFILAVGLNNGVVIAWNLAQALPIYQILAFSGAVRQLLISAPHGSTTHPMSPAETLQFHVLAVGATSSHAPTPVAIENVSTRNNDSNYQQQSKAVIADDALLEPAVKLIDSHGHGNATLRIVMPRDKITDAFALSRMQPLAIGRLGTSRFAVAWDNGLVHTWHRGKTNTESGTDETWRIEHVDYQPESFGLAVLKGRKKTQHMNQENYSPNVTVHGMIATRHRLYMCNRLTQKTARPISAAKSQHRVRKDDGNSVAEYFSVAVLRSLDFLCRSTSSSSEAAKLGRPSLMAGNLNHGSTQENPKPGKLTVNAQSSSATRLRKLSNIALNRSTGASGEFANSPVNQRDASLRKTFSIPSADTAPKLMPQNLKPETPSSPSEQKLARAPAGSEITITSGFDASSNVNAKKMSVTFIEHTTKRS